MAFPCTVATRFSSISTSCCYYSPRNDSFLSDSAAAAATTAKFSLFKASGHYRACPLPPASHFLSHYSSALPSTKGSGNDRRRPGIIFMNFRESATTTPLAGTARKDSQLLVDNLLALVAGTDRGAALRKEDHLKVSELVAQLEQLCIPEPLNSPLIFGEWDVEYSSNPTASGGYYRSAIGRALLKTKEMVQTISPPDIVGNKVAFSLFGLFSGEVSLKVDYIYNAGKLRALENNWIEVTFDSPSFKLGSIQFHYGGNSQVKIAVLYLDERIRLGKGSRGSLFVFKRH
ncbi:hypothetical protein O6H91_15G014000 [Diphasiastrum complanatum]|uniref:Uncharacterized protein n=1 Tax=Diphasiastrum complanatum TaxID=34168 RepID=A0ACC2BG24_DIPCM|nr:hypothetical protein O6H91_15G014000 [Diphasiastrum complanatum]